MTSGIPGSTWRPHPATADRLAAWKHYARLGWPVDDIAAQLGITRHALDQTVVRARRHGHPDAIHHARAVARGAGTWHITRRKARGGTS